jgi:hypothetical protein
MPSRQRTAQGCGLCVRQVSSHWGVVERLAKGSISGQPSEEPSAPLLSRGFVLVVGTAGFEPATPCSQSRCADQAAPRPVVMASDLR